MPKLENIELDLEAYKVLLKFQNNKESLSIHFDTPSRRFYFALIALVVTEMKNLGKPGFIHIRKHENRLKLLDNSLAGQHVSKSTKDMWIKIRKAWRDRLPDLEAAALFKIIDRDLIPPYEKGGKYRYDCSDVECDTWANLFGYDENNKWRFKFAIDSFSLGLNDIQVTLGKLKDHAAWAEFLKQKRVKISRIDSVSKKIGKRPESIKSRRYLIPGITLLFLLLIAGVLIFNRFNQLMPPPSELEMSDKQSVAILPFVNISGDPDVEYFCDGVTDEIISKLARLKDLRVISRTSAFALKESDLDIPTIGDKLGVDNILEGSVRISGDKLRITTQLIKVADDSHLWAETYDREKKDIFDLQKNLARVIACNLKSRLGCEGGEILGRYSTENLDAYNLYLKGKFYFYRDFFHKAIEQFQKAIDHDPDYAAAYTGLARSFSGLEFFSFSKPNILYYQKAKSAALKALELDKRLPEAYMTLALLKMHYEWDWQGAEKAILRAIDLNPGSVDSHSLYGNLLRVVGRLDEAIAEGEIAIKLDPLSNQASFYYGLTLVADRQYEAAVSHLEATLEMYPEDMLTLQFLGDTYLLQNKYEESIALFEKVFRLYKDRIQLVFGTAGHAHGKVGNHEKARSILNEALETRKTSNFSPLVIALIYSGLGNTDKTFEWLEKAYLERDPFLIYIKEGYPQFWDLHDDPRFQALLKKMGFEE